MTTTPRAQAERHDPFYDRLHESPEFGELKRRYQKFVFPASFVFLGWYLLYVLMSNWAPDVMGTQVVGNINVALVFGLLQFASTFLIAFLYARYSNTHIDPMARDLEQRYVDEMSRQRGGRS